MKGLVLALALVTVPAWAQDKAPAPKKKQVAHKKATPEQIRKFNELQKKQAR
jgi:hypothetical protein